MVEWAVPHREVLEDLREAAECLDLAAMGHARLRWAVEAALHECREAEEAVA